MDDLLQHVARGESRAIGELLDRYGGLVYSLARRFSYGPSEVEDAVQDVFAAVWKSAGRYDASLGSEETFVAMVARRRLIDRRRRAQRRAAHEGTIDPALADGRVARADGRAGGVAERAAELSDDARRALEALESLRPEQQRCLRLSIYHGLSHEEIAASTGIPLGTVKTHVRRGLIAIRESLEKQSDEPRATKTRMGQGGANASSDDS